jgi:hypothetical protein
VAVIDLDPRQFVVRGEALVRDWLNRLSYGAQAPKVTETIWVRPADIERYICRMPDVFNRRNASGRVIDFAASEVECRPLEDAPQVRACYQRWCDNLPWDQTGEFVAMLRKIEHEGRAMNFRTEQELRARYQVLDEIYEEVSRTRTLRTRKELNPSNFREYGGVQVAIDADGRPVLGKSGGFHRLALAKILKLDVIPAEIGLVDVNAVGKLQQYRQAPLISENHAAQRKAVRGWDDIRASHVRSTTGAP